jgi:hypothetical protein
MTPDVFVSSSPQDQGFVEKIIRVLEARIMTCWASFRDAPGDSNTSEASMRSLEASKLLLWIVSEHSDSSIETTKEIAVASQMQLRIVPV